jgi:putative flippase GtrA
MILTIKYTLFAVISTLFNLLFQYISFLVYNGALGLYVGMFWGTLAGLVSKYILDKKCIFYHTPKDRKDDAKRFIFYSFTGVFTTLIFWSTEIAFNALFAFESAKYIGAAIGLAIGYVTKYHLDKRFVFRVSHESA